MTPAGYDDDPDSDGPAGDSSLFDELFVSGAQFREETAAERAARAAEERREERRREQQAKRQKLTSRFSSRGVGRRRALAFGLFGAVVLITWLLGRGGEPSDQAGEAEQAEGTEAEAAEPEADPRPDTIRVTHAIPADVQSSPLAVDTIRTEIDIASRWLASQTGGRTLRFAEAGSQVAIAERRLSITSADLAARTDAAVALHEELGGGEDGAEVIRLVFAPVRFPDKRCGETAGTLVIVWIGSCDADPSAGIEEFGDGTTTVIAHEIMHALGAVESCAPNHGRDGHVTDDRTDLMYVGDDTAPGPEKVLDPGRDDYLEHDNEGCWDVALHPAWRD